MIYYFSGTGNTRLCAEALARQLDTQCNEFNVSQLRQPHNIRLATKDPDVIFMFPVYAWGIPPVVYNILDRAELRFSRNVRVWMVATCGDEVGLTASSFRKVMKYQSRKVFGTFSVMMPNTYVCMKGFDVDDPDTAQKKIDAMPARIAHIAEVIAAGQPAGNDVVKGHFAWFKSHIIYHLFKHFGIKPKYFGSDEECTSCGLCRRMCPMENIVPGVENRPCWGNDCAMCLRCYHICPNHSLIYKNKTLNKGQKKVYLQTPSDKKS